MTRPKQQVQFANTYAIARASKVAIQFALPRRSSKLSNLLIHPIVCYLATMRMKVRSPSSMNCEKNLLHGKASLVVPISQPTKHPNGVDLVSGKASAAGDSR